MTVPSETVYTHVNVDLETGQVRVRSKQVVRDDLGVIQFEKDNPEILDDRTGPHATAALGAMNVELAAKLAEVKESAAKAVNIAEAAAAAAHALKDEAEARAEGLEKERDQAVATIEEIHARENEALVQAKEAEAALVAEQDAHAETKATLEAVTPSV